MSKRTQQLGSVLHRATQSVLNDGLADPRLDGSMVTVTQVKVTDDGRTAVISVSVMPEKRQKLAWHALRDASRHIRREAAELVSVHRMPEFVFKLDTSIKKQAQVLDAIARANAEAQQGTDPEPATPPPPTPGDDAT
ncbi:MAG: hypothetical protein Tsb0013_02430 [Phycisphaerales bacterium]